MTRPLSRRAVLRLCAPFAGVAVAGCSGESPESSPSTTTTPELSQSPRPVVSVAQRDVHVEGWPLEWADGDPLVRGRVLNGTSDYVLYIGLRIVLVDGAGTRRHVESVQVLGITPSGTENFSVRLYGADVDPETVTDYRLEIETVHFE